MPTLWKYSPQSSLPSRLKITGELKKGKEKGRHWHTSWLCVFLAIPNIYLDMTLCGGFFANWFPLFPINRTECSSGAARRQLMVTCTERCWLVSTCRDVTGLWISLARALCGNIQNTEGCLRSVSKATNCHTQPVLCSIFHLFYHTEEETPNLKETHSQVARWLSYHTGARAGGHMDVAKLKCTQLALWRDLLVCWFRLHSASAKRHFCFSALSSMLNLDNKRNLPMRDDVLCVANIRLVI